MDQDHYDRVERVNSLLQQNPDAVSPDVVDAVEAHNSLFHLQDRFDSALSKPFDSPVPIEYKILQLQEDHLCMLETIDHNGKPKVLELAPLLFMLVCIDLDSTKFKHWNSGDLMIMYYRCAWERQVRADMVAGRGPYPSWRKCPNLIAPKYLDSPHGAWYIKKLSQPDVTYGVTKPQLLQPSSSGGVSPANLTCRDKPPSNPKDPNQDPNPRKQHASRPLDPTTPSFVFPDKEKKPIAIVPPSRKTYSVTAAVSAYGKYTSPKHRSRFWRRLALNEAHPHGPAAIPAGPSSRQSQRSFRPPPQDSSRQDKKPADEQAQNQKQAAEALPAKEQDAPGSSTKEPEHGSDDSPSKIPTASTANVYDNKRTPTNRIWHQDMDQTTPTRPMRAPTNHSEPPPTYLPRGNLRYSNISMRFDTPKEGGRVSNEQQGQTPVTQPEQNLSASNESQSQPPPRRPQRTRARGWRGRGYSFANLRNTRGHRQL